jgi:multiple sugar transport system permease protein
MALASGTLRGGRMSRGKGIADALTYVVLIGWLGFIFFPLYWLLTMSFKREMDIFTSPPKLAGFQPTFDNYLEVLNIARVGQTTNTGAANSNFPAYFLHSVIIVGCSIVITTVLGLFAAYAVSRYRFHGRDAISVLILFTQMIPSMLIMMPLYIIYRTIGLYNTYGGLVIAYQLFSLPFFIWLLRSHVSAVPRELEDAARVDGCNLVQILWNVVIPLIAPGLVSSGILVFIGMWNSWITALLLGGSNIQPVTVGIMNYSTYDQIQWARLAAASVICVVPEIIAGLWIQRYIVKGLGAGSVKG